MSLKITDVQTTITSPGGVNLVVVKILTSDDGLFGLGCATFTQRSLTVKTTIDQYIKPILIGKNPANITDIWQLLMNNSYWRNGPVLNNAVSGIDMALWDIKGKLASMPLYDLLGGKCREGVAIYRHADGATIEEVCDSISAFVEQGYSYIRCQHGMYGGNGDVGNKPDNAPFGIYYDPKFYMKSVIKLFEEVRSRFGWDLEFCHDTHERLAPIDAVNFAKEIEQFKLFFLEDLLPPEQLHWFERIRQHSTIPLSVGELFTNPNEWLPLITNRLIDYIRVHISQIGGITPAVKLANLSDSFGVRTAWHGPPDLTPIGHAVNVHLSMTSPNFGIQEWSGFHNEIHDVFTEIPEIRKGYIYLNNTPGIGVSFDEKAAAKYPFKEGMDTWTMARIPDGTLARP